MYDALMQLQVLKLVLKIQVVPRTTLVWRPDDFTRVLCQVAHACNHATANILTGTPLLNAIDWGMNL